MPKTQEEVREDIERVLGVLREGLALHGGNVELVKIDLESGTAYVRLKGACVGCPMSELTLKAGIEETVCQMVPEIKQVVPFEEPLEAVNTEPST